MLVTETIELSGRLFVHNYSDNGKYIIRNDGTEFADAMDLTASGYSYTESTKDLPEEKENDRI